MKGISLRYEADVKYLNIITNGRIKFNPQLDKVKDKLMNLLGQIRRGLRCEWGLIRRAVRDIE